MKLTRTISRWKGMNPDVMADGSKAALVYALKDARADILALSELLIRAAYPRRGTDDARMDIQQFSEIVQSLIALEDVQ